MSVGISREQSGRFAAQGPQRAQEAASSRIDIPLPSEVQALIAALNTMPRWRPLLFTAIFTGMGPASCAAYVGSTLICATPLCMCASAFDRYNVQGLPKSDAGTRTIPIGPLLVNTLREWRLACPKSELDLVFPTGAGQPENLGNIIRRGLWPATIAAGLSDPIIKDGKPVRSATCHAFRQHKS